MKPNLHDKKLQAEITDGMKNNDGDCYVPIQKLTIAVLSIAVDEMCHYCKDRRKCKKGETDCLLKRAKEKMVDAIQLPPFMDKDYNMLPLPKAEDDIEPAEHS